MEPVIKSIEAPMNVMQNKYLLGGVLLVVIGIMFFMWVIMKKTKKLEKESKNNQKINNEVTNLKYGLQDTVNVVRDLREKFSSKNGKSRKHQPREQQQQFQTQTARTVLVPEYVQKKVNFEANEQQPQRKMPNEKLEIESVNSDDVDGESEIIELEEGSEEELESESSDLEEEI